ncbi:MAG: hypothetical protein ACJAWP_000462 [Porticoccus sp.]|jgi:hypothetical protein|tara:strand:- start:827 stop:985 length:159 start_codon:yes stop_codon:yes gene_type:complete
MTFNAVLNGEFPFKAVLDFQPSASLLCWQNDHGAEVVRFLYIVGIPASKNFN